MMTFAYLAVINKTRCESPLGFNHPLKSWSLSDWLVALAGEAGEACNVVKKLNRIRDGIVESKTEEELLRDLEDEIADVVIYADLCAQRLGTSLEKIIKRKFNKTSDKLDCPIKLV